MSVKEESFRGGLVAKSDIEVRKKIEDLKAEIKQHEEYLKSRGFTIQSSLKAIEENKLAIEALNWVLDGSAVKGRRLKW